MPTSEPPSSPSHAHTIAVLRRRQQNRRGSSVPPANRDDKGTVTDRDATADAQKGKDDDTRENKAGNTEDKKSSTPTVWEHNNPTGLEAIVEEGSSCASTVGNPEQVPSSTSPDDAIVTPAAPNLSEPLPTYDWAALNARYEAQLERLHQQEEELMEEFGAKFALVSLGADAESLGLVQMFRVWAITGQETEEDRGRKRLRTQVAFVQMMERETEEKRLHYIKVVQAFESALALLD